MRTAKKTEYKIIYKTRKKVKMIEKIVNREKVVLEEFIVKKKAIRMIKSSKMVKKRFPPDFRHEFTPIKDCSCHMKECDCVGATGCWCAYPECDCAPDFEY
jgi:hypothetical protein